MSAAPGARAVSSALLHAAMARLTEEGGMRALGPAFARFIESLAPQQTPAPLLIACAVLSEMEGRGHSCLLLADLASNACEMLSWPPEQWQVICDAAPVPVTENDWHACLQACAQVRLAGQPDLRQPLVLDAGRLYLRRYWNDETSVSAAVAARAAQRRDVDPVQIRQWLDRLFERDHQDAGGAGGVGADWQKMACALAVRSHLSIITGGPGTGKTYTVARLLALLVALDKTPQGLRIALAAPTGKAATRLKSAITSAVAGLQDKLGAALPLAGLLSGMDGATTLHGLLGVNPDTRRSRHHAGNLLDIDVLVVDEASMIHLEMMAQILAALPPTAILVLLGDKDQLASVEAGAVLGDLCAGAEEGRYDAATRAYFLAASGETLPAGMLGNGGALAQQTVMLRKSHRFGGPIGALAQAVNHGSTDAAKRILRASQERRVAWQENADPADVLRVATEGREGVPTSYRPYLTLLQQRPAADDPGVQAAWIASVLVAFDTFRLLCAVRDGEWGVQGLNAALQKQLDAQGLLRCRGEWYAGRPVMVTRNDRTLNVFNGDVGVTLPDPAKPASLRVYFLHGDGVHSVLASRLAHVETAFAMTVHKVQGSEYQHAVLVLPPGPAQVVARELTFTGITRAKTFFTLITPAAGVFDAAVAKRTLRASGLQAMLAGAGA